MNLQASDRIKRGHPIYKKKIPNSKVTSMHSFEPASPEQILKRANDQLEDIKEKKGDLTLNLNLLCSSLHYIHEFDNATKFRILNIFCTNFPYSAFFDLAVNGETPKICLLSIVIFSYCANSKKFPRQSFSTPENIGFILSLFSKIKPKYHDHVFNILNESILHRPDIRDFIINTNILTYFNQRNTHHRYIYSNKAVEFLSTCLSMEPDIKEEYAIQINLILRLSVESFQGQKITRTTKISLLKTIFPILNILPRRIKNNCQVVYNPQIIRQELLTFIFSDIIAFDFIETFIPIMEIATIVKLDDNHFITLVMNFLGKVTDKQVVRCCRKILNDHSEQWKVHPQIVEYILTTLELKKNSISFITQQNYIQILIKYTEICPQMNMKAVEYIFNFINDKEIGSVCIQFIFHAFSAIFGAGGSSENQEIAKFLFELNLNRLEDIAAGNEGDSDSQNTAASIIDIMN